MNKIPIGTRVMQKNSRNSVNSGNCIAFWDGRVGIVVAHKSCYTGVYFEDNFCRTSMRNRGHSLDGQNPHGVVGGWWFFRDDLDVLKNKVQIDKKYEELYT